MKSKRNSVRLCCFFCAVLSGILWMILARGDFFSVLGAQESPAAGKEGAKEEEATDDSKVDGEAHRYQFRKDHSRDGTGKFYQGREIALVMGFQAADWLERPEREEEERLSELVRALKLQPGEIVADIGAGSGVISMMMAREVGDTGKVVAVDIQREMLNRLSDQLKNRGITNIELLLATEKSPNLEKDSVDLAILVDVYHEFAYPFETMLALSKALKPGGRVAFVEYRREDPEVPIKLIHKMSQAQIKKEIGQPEFGLKWVETIGTLPRQHIVVFKRPK